MNVFLMKQEGGFSLSQLTRRAIVEATVRLAEQKSLNKITVRDIVEACGITRNTFYYYFHDIYDVLEDAIEISFERIREMRGENVEASIFALIELFTTYKKVWINLYKTVGHDQLAAYISKRLHEVLMQELEEVSAGMSVEEKDLQLICAFYEESLMGLLFRWLREDKAQSAEELKDKLLRMRVIFDGHVRFALENCRKDRV